MNFLLQFIQKNRFYILLTAILFVHFSNMSIDVMEIDAAQYASISLEMLRNHSYLQIFHHGMDYLDKPPLLFWSGCLSFNLFGVSNFTYKLIPVITLCLGIYATYRYTKLWYNEYTAKIAALVLASCQGYFLMSNDVRTDGLLTGWVMCSVWLISEYLQKEKFRYLVLGAIAAGLGMLAKGPVALICVGIAIGSNLLFKKKYASIFKIQWIFFLAIVGATLLPMTYGLYQQFDLHPEKSVYDLQGPSGVKFFFWTQSFGRITGDIYWDNNTSFFYFFQTIFWDFQPWITLLVGAFVYLIYQIIKNGFRSLHLPEYASLVGFVLVLLMLSMSKYKLPHYIFVIFPFASILVANYLSLLSESKLVLLSKIQLVIIQVFFCLIAVNFLLFFPPASIFLPLICLGLWVLIMLLYFRLNQIEKVVIPTLLLAFTLNLVLSYNFYPNLLQYQAGGSAGKWVNQNNPARQNIYSYKVTSHAFDFYSQQNAIALDTKNITQLPSQTYVYTNEEGKNELSLLSNHFSTVKELSSFRVSGLTLPFLIANSREKELRRMYVLSYK